MYNIFTGGEDIALTKEDLQAIGSLMDSKLAMALEPIKADIASMKEDIDQIKEDTAITREAVNSLIEWTDEVSGVVEVRFPVKKKQG